MLFSLPIREAGKIFAAAALLSAAAGCAWWSNGTGAAGAEPENSAVRRYERIEAEKRFVCLIALTGRPYAFRDAAGKLAGIEPEIVRRAAAEMKLDVNFVEVPRTRLTAYLRNGRGDLAAGSLETAGIEASLLAPVLEYANGSDGSSRRALMVRGDDPRWKQRLADTMKKIGLEKILAAGSNTMGSAHVELTESGGEPEISVSAARENDGKDKK